MAKKQTNEISNHTRWKANAFVSVFFLYMAIMTLLNNGQSKEQYVFILMIFFLYYVGNAIYNLALELFRD